MLGRLWSALVGGGRRRRCSIVDRSRSDSVPGSGGCLVGSGRLWSALVGSGGRFCTIFGSRTPTKDSWLHLCEQALVQCTDSTFPLASGKQLVHVCSGPAKLRYQWIPAEVHEVLGLRQLFRTVQSIFQNLCHIQPCSAGGWKHVDSNVDSTSQSSHSKPATIKQCVH